MKEKHGNIPWDFFRLAKKQWEYNDGYFTQFNGNSNTSSGWIFVLCQ
ncbi:hypothetical protein XBJ1_2251 [Xenorhabdus bovienii SS-2004]|uniref:Uncharacterized protein n=1 Tax=Xenorhabdus bovienii (strain SS-2004) TaxID=406818 RepID=D3V227_XENBS|nr:hypothetical protein XBJ1_2251 [Xenorhabdus bovienii SS-2004]